jgi:hypothetical protein
MSRQESPKIPHKRSRLSNEGGRGTPSLTETLRTSETHISARQGSLGGETSDQRKSNQRRRLSNEYVNRSSRECAQNSAMDAVFLDRLHINTPTPENVGIHHDKKICLVIFFMLYIYIYIYIIFLCFLFLLNIVITFKCVCVEDAFNGREDNERERGYHEDSNIGEEGEGEFGGRYRETKDCTPTSTYPSYVGDELPWEGILKQWPSNNAQVLKAEYKMI